MKKEELQKDKKDTAVKKETASKKGTTVKKENAGTTGKRRTTGKKENTGTTGKRHTTGKKENTGMTGKRHTTGKKENTGTTGKRHTTGKKKVQKKRNRKPIITIIVLVILCVAAAVIWKVADSSMSYDDYNLSEYLKVGKYKGLDVAPYAEISVTDDEVDAQIQGVLQQATKNVDLTKEDTIANGDTVNIDYTGKIDGKKFEGGSAKGQSLAIGSGSFIDGFESGLIGKNIGSKVELNLTFPEDYQAEDLKGKDVVFTVTINSATRAETPEYNLDFVKNTTKYNTLDAYEASIRKQLMASKKEEAITTQKTTLWSEALDNTKVKKYPQRELDHYKEFNSQQIDDMAESYGVSREDMLANYQFGDEKEFAAINEDSSKLRVKQEMLIKYIADKEGLTYTDDEKKELISSFEAQGYDEAAVETQTGRPMDEYVHIELLYQKVLNFLLEKANITGEPTTTDTTIDTTTDSE